jgi:hypothetical protein
MQFSDSVLLVITVPKTHGDLVRKALGEAGAGQIGNYSYCSHTTEGIGRFSPEEGANPHIGSLGTLEEVVEERIETPCPKHLVDAVLKKVYEAHPYEETVIYASPLYQIPQKSHGETLCLNPQKS